MLVSTVVFVAIFSVLVLTPSVPVMGQDSEPVIHTQAFAGNTAGHSQMEDILVADHKRNLLALPGTKLVCNTSVPEHQTDGLTDGTGGVWVGEGRIEVGGKPCVLVYQLDRPRSIDMIRIFTSNSDARANQDFEVYLDGHLAITSGTTVIGGNTGPFISTISLAKTPLQNGKYTRLEFRFWDTYNVLAGKPGKDKTAATSWCSVVELQVLGNQEDMFTTANQRLAWEKAQQELTERRRLTRLSQHTGGVSDTLLPLKRAIDDMVETWPETFAQRKYTETYEEFVRQFEQLTTNAIASGNSNAIADTEAMATLIERYQSFRRTVLLSNPLIHEFDSLLAVRRSNSSPRLGLPCNWESNSSLPKGGFDDAIVKIPVLSESTNLDKSEITTIYKPEKPYFVGDVDLNWDADKILFSSVGTNNRWQVFELPLTQQPTQQPTPVPLELTADQPDIDSYDACYLPDGRIVYTSTAIMAGVPCVYGSSHIATLFLMNADGTQKRQLAFDQEHSWNPSVLNNGRILYQRWEYADIPHSNSRQLFQCNPDGTGQLSYYSSNSYWPNSLWNARAIPGHRSMVVSVITGHHDSHRAGELVLLDPARGRFEADGCIQRIPGFGKKVVPIIKDGLVGNSWPKFLHPFPLSEKYFLVSSKPTPSSRWGIYLVDVFDNAVLLHEDEQYALLEPIPFRAVEHPTVIPDRVDLTRKDAEVYIADIYNGPGLKDVPRGTVKQLRLFTYHFSYQNMGGLMGIVGVDGPWDIKQVLGTVPVYPDGSARFQVPANTPISLQPLDENGQALQLMRSWLTAMPGELLQCNGCHEDLNQAAIPKTSEGFLARPSVITPWYGPRRGFAYAREVQPVIDKYCLDCHDGGKPDGIEPDLRGDVYVKNYHSIQPGEGTGYVKRDSHFSIGYFNLQRYVRRAGIESDMHLLEPKEFAADTTDLYQLVLGDKTGSGNGVCHHGVRLSDEARDRILTWMDLNCPYHGTWGEATKDPANQRKRRIELAQLYANLDPHDAEQIVPTTMENGANMTPVRYHKPTETTTEETALAETAASETVLPLTLHIDQYVPLRRTIDLGDGCDLEMVRVPAGRFRLGDREIIVPQPYWISSMEITNYQYSQFDPGHDSRVESKHCYQFGIHGYPVNLPDQPVCRVSWQSASAFCKWLSARSGLMVTLPTADEWEWSARAGAAGPFWYGSDDTDFSSCDNLADMALGQFATNPYTINQQYGRDIPEFDDWIPRDGRFNDGMILSGAVGKFRANPWGLRDVHGNVAEWTRTPASDGRYIVKGGSWYDRPARSTLDATRSYPAWQRVFNVGFRIIATE